MVGYLFPVIIVLLVCFFCYPDIRGIRGYGLVRGHFQGLVGYGRGCVLNLLSCQVLVRDDHLVFDAHGRFFRHADVFRVPGILFLRCLSARGIPLAVVFIFYKMFLCLEPELVVPDIRAVILFCFLDHPSFRIKQGNGRLLQFYALRQDVIRKDQIPCNSAGLAVGYMDCISDRVTHGILFAVCFLSNDKARGVDIYKSTGFHGLWRAVFFYDIGCRGFCGVNDFHAVDILGSFCGIGNGQPAAGLPEGVVQLPSVPVSGKGNDRGPVFRFVIFVFIQFVCDIRCAGGMVPESLSVTAIRGEFLCAAVGSRFHNFNVIVI